MTTDELLAQLRGSKTDLRRFVEVVLRDDLPHLVVPANAVRAWQKRELETWAMVCDWLAEQARVSCQSKVGRRGLRQHRTQVLVAVPGRKAASSLGQRF